MRTIDSRQLKAFAELAQTGSFTQAAKRLFLSQSAISHSMRALEEDVGCRLLDRKAKKVVLTLAGEHLLHHANKILREMTLARNSLENLGKWGKGRLRIGASSTACQYIIPPVLREFQQSYPNCQITIERGDSDECVELVEQNRIDLAVTIQPKPREEIEFVPLFTDELLFLMSPSHPWAQKEQVVRDEIRQQNYVLYNKTSETFRLIESYFREQEIVLNTMIELANMEAIKELIKLGLGVGILAPWIARKEIAEKTLVALPLGRRKLKRTWGILHSRGRRLSLPEVTFQNHCRTVTEGIARAFPAGATT